MNWGDYIVSPPDVIGGKPRVDVTRLGVAFLLGLFAQGWTREQVLESYPHLTPRCAPSSPSQLSTSEEEMVFTAR